MKTRTDRILVATLSFGVAAATALFTGVTAQAQTPTLTFVEVHQDGVDGRFSTGTR